MRGLCAVILAATLALAYVPSAHADSGFLGDANETGYGESTHEHDAAHTHAKNDPQDADGMDCHEAGLCTAVAIFSTETNAGFSPATIAMAEAHIGDLVGLYEPGLDLPPPRRS